MLRRSLIAFLCCCSGCVTVRVDSEPPGAKCYLNGRYVGATPFTQTFGIFEGFAADVAAVLPGYDLSDCPELQRGGAGWNGALRTAPAGAVIYKNGRRIGTSPMYDTGDIPEHYKVVWQSNVLPRASRALQDVLDADESPSVELDRSQIHVDCDWNSLPKVAVSASIAVLDFQITNSPSHDTGATLADMCRESVYASHRFVLVDRETMKTLLSEEDFATTFDCDDTQCLVDYGRKLRAQKIIHGRVGQIGDVYILSLKLIDVGSTEVEGIATDKTDVGIGTIADLVEGTTCKLLRQALSNR